MSLAPGTRLGPYEILSALGAGGMGEVYRARDTRLDRAVAIKILAPAISAAADARQRFEREARVISQMSHPHICALYDVGDHEGTAFLVMELLAGETLSARLGRGALAPQEVSRLGAQIAEALDAAHRSGIVHRDLKPANVMLTASGVKLLDFGLAKPAMPVVAVSGMTAPTMAEVTAEGTVTGTVQYMAPEQLEGRPPDARSDIFTLGAVLYEMATWRKAFPGVSSSVVASAILRDDAPAIPSSPSLMRGGAYDVWEMNLERQVETRLTLSPSSEGAGPWMPDGRSMFFNADHGASPEIFRKDLASGREEAAVPASRTYQQPDDVSPDGKWLLFTQRTPKSGNDIWLMPLDASRPPSVVFETPFDENEPRFSPDGHFFSFASNASGRPEIYVSPFPTGGELTRVSTAGGYGARWSRSGHELFYRSGGQIMSVPMQTESSLRIGQPVALFSFAKEHAWFGFDVSPDGRFLAVVSQTRAVEQPLTVVLNWTVALAK